MPWTACALWAIVSFIPSATAALVAATPSQVELAKLLRRFLEPAVSAYLGSAPLPLALYAVPLLPMTPAIVVLLAGHARRASSSPAIARAGRAAAWWGALNAAGLAIVACVIAARGAEFASTFGWAARLGWPLFVSALPAMGMATVVTSLVRSRRWSITLGLVAVSLVGFAGGIARYRGRRWVPAALDQALFGYTDRHASAAAAALVYAAVGLALATAFERRRAARAIAERGSASAAEAA